MQPKKKSNKAIYIILGVLAAIYALALVVPDTDLNLNLDSGPDGFAPGEKTPNQILRDSLRSDTLLLEQLALLKTSIPKQDWSEFTSNLSGPAQGVQQIRRWNALREKGLRSGNDDIVAAAKKLNQTIKSAQIKAFPMLRKAYGEYLGKALWEQDISVKTLGKRKDIIELTGGAFITNSNIAESHESFGISMDMLRFYESHYRWMESSGGQSYSLNPRGKDGELDESKLE